MNKATNTTCRDFGLVLMPLRCGSPFALLTHSTETDAFCMYSEMTDVPLCNVQSLFRNKILPALIQVSFHERQLQTLYFKSGY